jgi:hypothetical protein
MSDLPESFHPFFVYGPVQWGDKALCHCCGKTIDLSTGETVGLFSGYSGFAQICKVCAVEMVTKLADWLDAPELTSRYEDPSD